MAIYDDTVKKNKQYLRDAQLDAIVKKSQQYSRENAGSRAEAVTTAVTNYDTAYRGLQNMGLAGRQGTELTGEVPRLKKKIEGTFDQTNARLYGAEKNAINAYGDALAAQTQAQQAAQRAQQVQQTVRTNNSAGASQPLIKGFKYATDASMNTLEGYLKSNVAQVALGNDGSSVNMPKIAAAGGTVNSAATGVTAQKAAQEAAQNAVKAKAAMAALGIKSPVRANVAEKQVINQTVRQEVQQKYQQTQQENAEKALTEYSQVRSLLTGETKAIDIAQGRKAVDTVTNLMGNTELDLETRYSIATDYLQNSKATSKAAEEAAERVIAEANGLTYVSDEEYTKLKQNAEEAKKRYTGRGIAPSSLFPSLGYANSIVGEAEYESSTEYTALRKAEQDRESYKQQAPELAKTVREYPARQTATEGATKKYESIKGNLKSVTKSDKSDHEMAGQLEEVLLDDKVFSEDRIEMASDILRTVDEETAPEVYALARRALGIAYGLPDPLTDAEYNQRYKLFSMTKYTNKLGLPEIGSSETRNGWEEAQSNRAEFEYYIDALVDKAKYGDGSEYVGFKAEKEAGIEHSLEYEYVNNPDAFTSKTNSALDHEANKYDQGSTAEYYQYLSDEERGLYNHIYATEGKNKAHEYIEHLWSYLEMRRAQQSEEDWQKYTEEHPVASNLATVLLAPGEVFPAVERLGMAAYNEFAGTKKPLYIDTNTSSYDAANMRSTVRSKSSELILGDNPTAGKQVLNFAYQTGMSMADSASMMLYAGAGMGWVTDVIFYSSASNEAYKDAISRGGTQSQAMGASIAAGIAEAMFEHVSLDKVLKGIKTGGFKYIRNILQQGGIEASEEICTEIANILTDKLFMGDKSNVSINRQKYLDKGLSEKEADMQVFIDAAGDVFMAGLGGAASGFLFGIFGSIGAKKSNKLTGEDIQKHGSTAYVIENATALGGDAATLVQEHKGNMTAEHIGEIYNATLEQAVESVKTEEDLATLSTLLEGKPISNEQAQGMIDSSKDLVESAGYDTSSAEALKESYNQRMQEANSSVKGYARERAQTISEESVASVYKSKDIKSQAPTLPTGSSFVQIAEASRQNFKAQSTIKSGRVELQLSMLKVNSNLSAEEQLKYARSEMTAEAQRKLSTISKLADALDMPVVVHDVMTGTSGFYGEDGKIHFALSGQMNVARVVAHELTHKMRADATEHYNAVHDHIVEDVGEEKFQRKLEKKAREYGYSLENEAQRDACEEEVIAELCEDMLSDTSSLERFAERHLEAAKALKDRLVKILNAIKQALGGAEKTNPELSQKTVDKWLDGLDAVLEKVQARQETLEGYVGSVAGVTMQDQESMISEIREVEQTAQENQQEEKEEKTTTVQEAKAEQEAEQGARKVTTQELELAVEATKEIIEHWERERDENVKNGFMNVAEISGRILAKNVQQGKEVESMLAKTRKGDALTTEELATLDKIYDDAREYSFYSSAEDWKAFREQGQKQQNEVDAKIDKIINKHAVDIIRADLDGYIADLKAAGLVGEGKAMSVKELKDLYNMMNEACDYVALHRAILDYGAELTTKEEIELAKASRLYTPVKENADSHYGISLDFSTLCRKRILMQMISERLQQRLKRAVLPEETVAIRREIQELQKEGYKVEVACALCYVEAARNKSPKVINEFLKNPGHWLRNQVALTDKNIKADLTAAQEAWKQEHYGNSKITKAEMTKPGATVKDYERTFKEWRQQDSSFDAETMQAIAMAIETVQNAPEQLLSVAGLDNLKRSLNKVDQMIVNTFIERVRQATHSKAQESDSFWVRGDGQTISQTLIDKLNLESGLRHQSWSDFQVIHTLDTMAMIIEIAQRRAKMQAYTKVPDMVYLCGRTGIMINMSLIPKGQTGLDANGHLIWDSVEGMDWDIMMKLRDLFPDTAGNIAIGVNEYQIKLLLASIDVDYVIPYHISGLNKKMRTLYEIQQWLDYTKKQEEKSNGRGKRGKAPMLYEWCNDVEGSKEKDGYAYMRKASEKYLQLCYERNLVPKFSEFLTNNGDGSYSLNDEYANYWKLLVDRKMVNQKTGRVIEQKAVLPKFDRDTVMRILTDAANDPHAYDNEIVADKVVDKLKDWDPNKNNASAEDVKTARAIEKKIKNAETVKKATQSKAIKTAEAGGVKAKFALDSLGRELSKGQQEYFSESEVRDGKWRLLPVYHATDADFTEFKREYLGQMTDGNASSEYVAATAHLGFWFNTKDVSKSVWTDSSKTKEVYLNIENPYHTSVMSLADEMEAEYGDAGMTSAEMGEAYRDELIRQGYDGIIATDEEFGGTSYVIFDSNQAKNTDNLNPTANPDIRYATDNLGLDEFRKPITMQDVEVLRSIGVKKSINSFADDEIRKAGKWAYKFYQDFGTKSPFFRRWFGDWRAHDLTPVKTVTASSEPNKANGRATNTDTGMVVSFGERVRKETNTHEKKAEMSKTALNDIEAIIQNAIYFGASVSDYTKKSKLSGTTFMHEFYTAYEQNGRTFLLKLLVEEGFSEKQSGSFDRAYQLKEIKNITPASNGVLSKKGGLTKDTDVIINNVADLYAFVKQYDKDFTAAKEASSVLLDAEGKPEKVYHGTAAYFTVFERGDIGYHVGTKAQAEDRIAGVKGGHVMELYACIKNPLYAAMDFGDWHGQNVAEMLIETEQFEDFDNRAEIEERLSEIAQMDNQQEADTALRKYLQGLGYDGIVYENRWEGEGESYIVFESSQLKSATDNIGLFDRNNPDIRYALDKDFLRETVNAIDTEGLEGKLFSLSTVKNLKGLGVWLKEPSRIFDAIAGDDRELRNNLHEIFEKPHSDATGRYASNIQKMQARVEQIALDAGALTVNKKGKKTYHEEVSAAIQNYGEGYHMKDCIVNAWVASQDAVHVGAKADGNTLIDKELTLKELRRNFGYANGNYIWDKAFSDADSDALSIDTAPYTLEDLKRDFPDSWEKIVKADEQFREMYEEYINDMNAMLEKIYPYAFSERDDTLEKLTAQAEKKENRIKETEEAINERLKRLGAIEAEMASKKKTDTKVYDTLRTRKGKINEAIADLKELKARYQEDLATIAAKKNYLLDMSKSGESLNRMHKLQYRQDYYHHFQELGQETNLRKLLFGNKQSDISPAIVGKSEQSKAKGRWAGFFQQRKGDARTADAVNGMLKYGTLAEYKLAFDPLVAYIRNAEQAVREISDDTNRDDLIRFLNNWGNAMAGKRQSLDRTLGEGGVFKTSLSKVVDWMQGRVIANTLNFNMRSSIVQISNIANATSIVMDGKDWINGIRCWSKMAKGDAMMADIMNQSNFLKSRLTSVEMYSNSKMAKMENFANWMLSIMDTISVKATWWAAYNQYVRDPNVGMYRAYDSAIDYADDVARRTHGGRGVGEKADAFNSKFVNFIAPFQLEVNNTWNLMKDNIKHKNAKGIINMMATTFAMNVVFEQLVGSTLLPFDMIRALWDIILGSIGIIDDDDDDDTKDDIKDMSKLAFQRFGAEVVSGVPFSNIATFLLGQDNIENWLGETDMTRYGSDTLAGGAVFSAASDIASLINWAWTGEQPKWETLISDLATILPPMGGKQLARTVIGATTALKGYSSTYVGGEEKVQFATDGDIGEAIHAMLFGKWALPEAAEYTGEDRFVQQFAKRVLGIKGLSASTGSFVDKNEFESARTIGLTGKEYFQLKTDLKEYSTQDGKRSWIYGMNLTAQQKAQLDALLVTSGDEKKVSNTIVSTRTKNESGEWNDWEAKADYTNETWYALSQRSSEAYEKALTVSKANGDAGKVLEYYEYLDSHGKVSAEEKRDWIYNCGGSAEERATMDAILTRNGDEVTTKGAIVYSKGKVVADYSSEIWYEISKTSYYDKAQKAYQSKGISPETSKKFFEEFSTLTAKDANGNTVSGLKAERTWKLLNRLNLTQAQKQFLYDLCFKK